MSPTPDIDSVLVQWGDRLFYPGNRIVKAPRGRSSALWPRVSAPRRCESGSRQPW